MPLSRPPKAVVIGASAGGVEAIKELFTGMPAPRIPILVVVHIPRDRPSSLASLFAGLIQVPVFEAEDKLPLEGGIYFAPADYHLLVDEGPRAALTVDAPVHYSRPSIDLLFESAGEVFGPGLLVMLLTGANADGADGLHAARRAGAHVCVQRPEEAVAPEMPRAALARGPVDDVLSLSALRALLHQALRAGP